VLVLGQVDTDDLEVYSVRPDAPAEQLTALAAFDGSGVSGSANMTVGDVDTSEPGDEIVVGEDGTGRRASRVRVFGGLATGTPRLLADFRALRLRTADWGPLGFALGDVFADPGHPGREIVVGDSRGRIYVYGINAGTVVALQRSVPFPETPRVSTRALAVGDVVPDNLGDEIVVGDDGSGEDGVVRVLDGPSAQPLIEFAAFEPGWAPIGVEVWVADVLASLPGAELLVGQGAAGGLVRVFSLARGVPEHVLDLPDPRQRTTSLGEHLTVGDLVPDLPGNEVAVAQSDPAFPVQVFRLDAAGAELIAELDSASGSRAVGTGVIGTIAIGH
jgi:hypothetical protein